MTSQGHKATASLKQAIKEDKASKTETLDLCQLPHPPFEIHKMINLPASVKIFKNKLKNRETDKSIFTSLIRQREIIN